MFANFLLLLFSCFSFTLAFRTQSIDFCFFLLVFYCLFFSIKKRLRKRKRKNANFPCVSDLTQTHRYTETDTSNRRGSCMTGSLSSIFYCTFNVSLLHFFLALSSIKYSFLVLMCLRVYFLGVSIRQRCIRNRNNIDGHKRLFFVCVRTSYSQFQ